MRTQSSLVVAVAGSLDQAIFRLVFGSFANVRGVYALTQMTVLQLRICQLPSKRLMMLIHVIPLYCPLGLVDNIGSAYFIHGSLQRYNWQCLHDVFFLYARFGQFDYV